MVVGLAKKILSCARKKFFGYFMIMGVIFLGVSHLYQYSLILDNYQAILTNNTLSKIARQKDKNKVLMKIHKSQEHILDMVEYNKRSLSTRIDIIESATDPEKKRRKLISAIREAIITNTDTKIDVRSLNKIAISVIDYSYQYNLSIPHILAQIKTESNFKVNAKSHAGAQGLMQIMPNTMSDEIIPEIGIKLNPWDIYDNIRAGCFYMSKMLHLNNNIYDDALRSYNFGYSNVLKVKAGELDFSLKRIIIEDEKEKEYLVDRRGEFILDDNQHKIEITLEDKYPRETRNYVKSINHWTSVFQTYGLEE